MGATGAGSAAFQGVTSIGNGYIQASAMRNQADYEKDISDLNNKRLEANAKQVDEAATDAEKRGNTAANSRAERTRQQLGAVRAMAAGEGATGSAAEFEALSQVQQVSATDQAAIKTNAYREAFGMQSSAIAIRGKEQENTFGARIKGNNLDYMAKSSMITGWTKGLGFGMNTASDVRENQNNQNNQQRRATQTEN